jgi:hypothetical protein
MVSHERILSVSCIQKKGKVRFLGALASLFRTVLTIHRLLLLRCLLFAVNVVSVRVLCVLCFFVFFYTLDEAGKSEKARHLTCFVESHTRIVPKTLQTTNQKFGLNMPTFGFFYGGALQFLQQANPKTDASLLLWK